MHGIALRITPYTIVLLVLAFATVSAGVSLAHEQEIKPIREQTVFHEYEKFQHTVPLPPKALEALLRTKEVKRALEFASLEQRDDPSGLFQAAEVHLSGSDEVDLVVEGFPPVSGADNTWFWVLVSAHTVPRVVLWTGGDSLEVLASRANGYKDIMCSWSSSSGDTTEWKYRFNGKRYFLWKETNSR
jgi:hypothetical protein